MHIDKSMVFLSADSNNTSDNLNHGLIQTEYEDWSPEGSKKW